MRTLNNNLSKKEKKKKKKEKENEGYLMTVYIHEICTIFIHIYI